MSDREGPKAALICEGCKYEGFGYCDLTMSSTQYDGTPADCPKMVEIPQVAIEATSIRISNSRGDGRTYLHAFGCMAGITPDEAEALATALLIAAQKARKP